MLLRRPIRAMPMEMDISALPSPPVPVPAWILEPTAWGCGAVPNRTGAGPLDLTLPTNPPSTSRALPHLHDIKRHNARLSPADVISCRASSPAPRLLLDALRSATARHAENSHRPPTPWKDERGMPALVSPGR